MNGQTIIDQETLDGLREVMEDEFDELLTSFFTETESLLADLESALSAGDDKALFATAHSLKSSCGNIGALPLSETARQLELLGRNQTTDGADGLLQLAQRQFQEVKQALE